MSVFRTVVRRGVAVACLAGARLFARNEGGGARILMYHRVRPMSPGGAPFDQLTVHPERFARQMEFLVRSGAVVSLDEAITSLDTAAEGTKVVVTFDDGYWDNIQYALPILKEFRIPATIFLTAGFCDQQIRHPRYPKEPGRLHLDWDEARMLAAEPGITIGSHTVTHPHLSRLSDDDAWREIAESRSRIERELAMPIRHFCYPSGDFGAREAQFAERAGYTCAVTVAPGMNCGAIDRYRLLRTEVNDRDTLLDFQWKLAGAYDPIHAVLHRRRMRRFEIAARRERMSRNACGSGDGT